MSLPRLCHLACQGSVTATKTEAASKMATQRSVDTTSRIHALIGVPVLVMDVGDVIVRTSRDAQYRELARRTGGDPRDVAHLVKASGLPEQLERGLISDAEFAGALGALMPRTRLTLADVRECWVAELIGLDPVVAPVAARWAGTQRLVLASNTNTLHWPVVSRLLEEAGIRAPAYLSFEIGLTKPDPRFFATIVDDHPSVAVYVDDRADNVAAATEAGMTGWLHRDPVATAAHLATVLGGEAAPATQRPVPERKDAHVHCGH
jgi:FMN phosphatase YigB (HAD superfamily)